MRKDDFRPSDNVEDDREASASRGGMPGGAGGLGIGTDHHYRLDQLVFRHRPERADQRRADSYRRRRTSAANSGAPGERRHAARSDGKFVALVLGDTEDRWNEIFPASGRTYHPPKLRLFARSERGALRLARSAMGPFYCPNDQRIYLDISFFDDLQNKFGGCATTMPASSRKLM